MGHRLFLATAGLAAALILPTVPASAQRGGDPEIEPPAAPTPRWPDGRPRLGALPGETGIWDSCCGNLADENTPFQPWARAMWEFRQEDMLEPHTRCHPSGGARQFVTPYGTEFVEDRELERIYLFDIGGPHTFRTIYLDGRDHPDDLMPSPYGHSIGHWDGDTLVVETTGFSERFWMDRAGTPHTEQLVFTERFTRTDAETLEYQITIDDPGAFTSPWTTRTFTMDWDEGEELFEYICQDNNFANDLMVGTGDEAHNDSRIVP